MMYKTRSVSSVQYPSHWNGLQFVVMSIFFCLLLDTSNTIASAQEIQKANIPGTFAWGGVTSDVTGTYLTAAQKPSSPIYNSPQQIFYSKDAGNTWATSNAPAIGYYGIAAAISTPNIVVAGGYNGIYISNDYGANWVSKSTFIGNGGAAISANGQIMALVKLTSSNCMAYSSNQGATWSTNLGPTGLTGSCESIAVSSNTIVIGTAGSGIYVSTNAGTSWTVTYPTTSTIISITYGGGVFYAGMRDSPYYILMSTDAGSSWQVTSGSQTTSPSVWQVAVASNVPSYLAVAATELYVTTDSGVTYTQKTGNSMTKVIAVNGDGSLALFNAGNNSISYLYYGNLATLTPAPSFAPSMAPTTNVVFPTNPKYAVSKLYSDASCTHFTSMGTIIVNTCLKVSNIRYMKFTCGTATATNTFYSDATCTTPTGSSSVFSINQGCSINGGTSNDYDAYMVVTACGATDPYVNYPADMPTQTYYYQSDCSGQVLGAYGYLNEVCLQETSSTSGEMNWDAGVSYTYTTPNCMGVATTHALTLSCSTTSSSYYGFPAHYYWKLTSSSSNNTLSAGAIAGIVIGSVVGVGLIVGLILYFVFMFKTKAPLSSQT